MNNNTTAPTYTLRGLQLIGWRDMQHALDYLFADGQLKQGTLVAINAEKMLTIEDNAEVRELHLTLPNLNMRMASALYVQYVKSTRRRRFPALPVPISGKS